MGLVFWSIKLLFFSNWVGNREAGWTWVRVLEERHHAFKGYFYAVLGIQVDLVGVEGFDGEFLLLEICGQLAEFPQKVVQLFNLKMCASGSVGFEVLFEGIVQVIRVNTDFVILD